MNNKIIHSTQPITLVGGGVVNAQDIALALTLAPTCVAADGGADAALTAGIVPDAVIGDLDSISDRARAQIPEAAVHHIAEQDSTDFDKVVRSVNAPVAVAVGFPGGRMDNALSVVHTLFARPDRRIVVLGEEDVVFLCPRRITLPTQPEDRVSLFPLSQVTGRSDGLFWPIEGLRFGPGVLSGTSNKATGPVTLEMDAPGMLCLLPRRFIQPVVQALLALPEPSQWPALSEPRKDPQKP